MRSDGRSPSDRVVVIASAGWSDAPGGGIASAVAELAGTRGARVVLLAPQPGAVEEIAGRLRERGVAASSVVADTRTDPGARAACEAIVHAEGRFDAWVADASTPGVRGPVLETSIADHRAELERSFWAVVMGVRAAIAHLRASGGGVVVHLTSVLARRAFPELGAHSAASHGAKAIADALRVELRHDGAGVAVAAIEVAAPIGAPFALDDRLRAARVVVRALERPDGERVVGAGGAGLVWAEKLVPSLVDRALRRARRKAGGAGRSCPSAPDHRACGVLAPRRRSSAGMPRPLRALAALTAAIVPLALVLATRSTVEPGRARR